MAKPAREQPAGQESADPGEAGRQAGGRWTKYHLVSLATLVFVFAWWYLATEQGWIKPLFLPAPQDVFQKFWEIATRGYKGHTLAYHTAVSLARLLTGFLAAAACGVVLGLASGYSRLVQAVLDPLVEFYRPLPPLAYYSLLILWFGIGNTSKVLLLFLAALAPIYINSVQGVLNVPEDRVHRAHCMGAGQWQVFWHVIFPSSLPNIFTGLRVAIGFSYTTLVAAEMVAANAGIGWMTWDARSFLQTKVIIVGVLLMGVTGFLLDRLIRLIENRLVPWKGKV